jgi:hypothetical protein
VLGAGGAGIDLDRSAGVDLDIGESGFKGGNFAPDTFLENGDPGFGGGAQCFAAMGISSKPPGLELGDIGGSLEPLPSRCRALCLRMNCDRKA